MVQFRPGQVVAGRYTVLAMIGRGGMGCIYRVRDNVLKEDVALKTLLPQFVRDKMVVERFFNEARIARSLSHPNIVRVHDIGMTGKIIYISMELVQGKSLRSLLEEVPPGDRMPINTTLKIMDELCAALEYAHRFTVHRDIKPENVMVAHDGSVKLMDFGISKLMDAPGLTATSVVMGTPYYMSPEQLKNSANVDARADVYSVGVMLYEILTGNMPTGIPKPASHLTREVPPALDPIVVKCVEPDPIDRYQTISDLRSVLGSLGPAVSSSSPARPKAVARSASRFSLRKAIGVIALLAIVALAGAGVHRIDSVHQTRQATPSTVKAIQPDARTSAVSEPTFEQIAELIRSTRDRVVRRNSTPEIAAMLEAADIFWSSVENSANTELARQALQRYFAPLWWQLDMVFVPPGDVAFSNGSSHTVVFVDGFFIDATEVTNADYLRFLADPGYQYPTPRAYLYANVEPDHPVSNVTYYDAQAYAAWAGKQLTLPGGDRARKQLPTEAQWARAAYGDSSASDLYPWGKMWEDSACNAAGDDDEYALTAPVKSFAQDKTWSGCYDMAGNVSEWTRSMFDEQVINKETGDPSFTSHVSIRGGNYEDATQSFLHQRYHVLYESCFPSLGFRCVLELPKTVREIEACLHGV